MPDTPKYPDLICHDCGKRLGRRLPRCASYYRGICDVCGTDGTVTEPRDFGHLRPGWQASVAPGSRSAGAPS